MSRDLTLSTTNALDDNEVYPFFAVELLFDSSPIRMWTGVGTLTVGGQDFLGAGGILDISAVEETAEIAAKGATITMSGVSSEALALALSEPYQGRVCNIYFGMMGESVFNEIFSGYMDEMNISDDPNTCSIELKVENRLVDLERARVARFTSSYLKSIYPDDKGLDFVEDLQDRKLVWGRSSD